MKKILFIFILILSTLYGYSPPKNNTDLKEYVFKSLKCDKVIVTPIYDSCYDYSKRGTLAVAYVLDGEYVNILNLDVSRTWKVSEEIPTEYRVYDSDYYKSGYDKGHLAFDRGFDYDLTMLSHTYILGVNSIPQSPSINRYIWVKVERYASDIAVIYGKAYVIDIVVYGTNINLLNNSIHIPIGLYKIIYTENDSFKECFYYSNELDAISTGDLLLTHRVNCADIVLSKIELFKLIP